MSARRQYLRQVQVIFRYQVMPTAQNSFGIDPMRNRSLDGNFSCSSQDYSGAVQCLTRTSGSVILCGMATLAGS